MTDIKRGTNGQDPPLAGEAGCRRDAKEGARTMSWDLYPTVEKSVNH